MLRQKMLNGRSTAPLSSLDSNTFNGNMKWCINSHLLPWLHDWRCDWIGSLATVYRLLTFSTTFPLAQLSWTEFHQFSSNWNTCRWWTAKIFRGIWVFFCLSFVLEMLVLCPWNALSTPCQNTLVAIFFQTAYFVRWLALSTLFVRACLPFPLEKWTVEMVGCKCNVHFHNWCCVNYTILVSISPSCKCRYDTLQWRTVPMAWYRLLVVCPCT